MCTVLSWCPKSRAGARGANGHWRFQNLKAENGVTHSLQCELDPPYISMDIVSDPSNPQSRHSVRNGGNIGIGLSTTTSNSNPNVSHNASPEVFTRPLHLITNAGMYISCCCLILKLIRVALQTTNAKSQEKPESMCV